MSKIALTMICKSSVDELALLSNCLKSISGHVDAIYVTFNGKDDKPKKLIQNKINGIVKKYGIVADYKVWNDNFAEMRRHNRSLVPADYEWILWLDTDDTVENPEKIREVLSNAGKLDGLMVNYDYEHDEFGNVTTEHINCRIFRNNGAIEWPEHSDLHETPTEVRRANRALTTDFKVIHHSNNERRNKATLRNIQIMEKMIERDGDTPDPRTMYYLGTAYIDVGYNERAIELLELYVKMSGWDEEVAQAHVWLGRLKRDQKDIPAAHTHFLEALWQNPKEITAMVELGATEMELKHWSKAIVWLEQGIVLKPSPTAIVSNPLERTYKPYMMLAQCYLEMGGKSIEKALQYALHAQKIRPDDVTNEYVDMLRSIMHEMHTVQSFINAVKKLDAEKAERAYTKLDEEYRSNPAVLAAMRLHRPPKVWEQKSIAIYCGSSVLKDWGPWSLETGIGGSEEAVIRLSKHLKDLGWKVTVYSNPGIKDGEYDGVVWKNYWEIDLRDTFDIFIAWRSPEFFDYKVNARKTYCWMHDVMDDADFTPERLANMTKVMLLSKYHRSVYPSIPEDKVFYTGNGIDPADFEKYDGKLERDTKQVIYQSSHVRGLDTLCDVWEDVIKEVPDAKLTVAYGWQSYDEINRNNPERMAWKDNLVARMEKLGITDLGRIGQDEIVKMTQTSGIWAYPTQFCEIYCHPAGTKVMTEYGEKNIEELLLTDRVLTHRGILKPIYQTMRRKADKLIKLNVRSGDDLLLTPNHPVYTKRDGEYLWVNAEDLTTADPLLTPAELLNTDYGWVDCAKFVINDNLGYKQNNLPTETHNMPDELAITPEFARFLGYFAGDGNANERGKVSVLVADRHPEHIKTVVDGFKHIGLEPDVAQKQGCKEYRVYNYQLARAFRKFFYDGKEKQLPLWLTSYPEALDGLLEADGHCGNGYNHTFTNTSDRLIGWAKIALAIRGYSGKAALRIHNNGKPSRTISWTQSHKLPQYSKVGGFIEKKIKSIEIIDHNDWVYNIEVEDDHSYVSNGSVVHNCITAVKAQAGGAWPVCTDFAALAEYVNFGDISHMEAIDDNTPIGKWQEGDIEKYTNDLIYRLKNPIPEETRQNMMNHVRAMYSWKNTAGGWNAEFNA